MSVREVRIDERTWGQAETARRFEWQASIRELVEADDQRFADGADSLHVTATAQGTTLSLRDASGAELATCDVSWNALSEHVAEYVDVVRRMDKLDEGWGSSRVEALDMAKKLAHDDAARTLKKLCAPLGIDKKTGRRLWTLLFALKVDTTRLTGVRAHRPVR